jgi:hypothetical protein
VHKAGEDSFEFGLRFGNHGDGASHVGLRLRGPGRAIANPLTTYLLVVAIVVPSTVLPALAAGTLLVAPWSGILPVASLLLGLAALAGAFVPVYLAGGRQRVPDEPEGLDGQEVTGRPPALPVDGRDRDAEVPAEPGATGPAARAAVAPLALPMAPEVGEPIGESTVAPGPGTP